MSIIQHQTRTLLDGAVGLPSAASGLSSAATQAASVSPANRSANRGGGPANRAGSHPGAMETSDAPRLRRASRRPRPSLYRDAILRFVAHPSIRIATVHQVLERFWGLDGRSVSNGWRVIRQLVDDGWLASRPLDPEAGATSRRVLTLTRKARVALAAAGRPTAALVEHSWVVDHRLQQTQMLIEREAEGWRLVDRAEVPSLLKRAAIAGWRGRRPFGIEADWQRRIQAWTPQPMPLDALWHTATGEVRLIMPVRPGLDFRRTFRRLDRAALALLSTGCPIGWELVGAKSDHVDALERALRSWARTGRNFRRRAGTARHPSGSGGDLSLRIEVFRTAPFRSMPHPHRRERRRPSVYAENGVASPLTLR